MDHVIEISRPTSGPRDRESHVTLIKTNIPTGGPRDRESHVGLSRDPINDGHHMHPGLWLSTAASFKLYPTSIFQDIQISLI